jgi:prepilin-type processing-associated H-X9-DG protein
LLRIAAPQTTRRCKAQENLPRVRSYAANTSQRLERPSHRFLIFPQTVYREAEIKRPSGIFGFIDVNERSIDTGVFSPAAVGGWDNFQWWNTPAERHASAATLSFLDGHVQSHKWRQTPKLWTIDSPGRAVNAADREDLRWLFEATPYWDWPLRRGPNL